MLTTAFVVGGVPFLQVRLLAGPGMAWTGRCRGCSRAVKHPEKRCLNLEQSASSCRFIPRSGEFTTFRCCETVTSQASSDARLERRQERSGSGPLPHVENWRQSRQPWRSSSWSFTPSGQKHLPRRTGVFTDSPKRYSEVVRTPGGRSRRALAPHSLTLDSKQRFDGQEPDNTAGSVTFDTRGSDVDTALWFSPTDSPERGWLRMNVSTFAGHTMRLSGRDHSFLCFPKPL